MCIYVCMLQKKCETGRGMEGRGVREGGEGEREGRGEVGEGEILEKFYTKLIL